MTIPPNPHPEQVEAARKTLAAAIRKQGDSAQSAEGIEAGRDHAVWAHVAINAMIAFASLANRPADDGELERLREYHAATEEMVCVWRDTNDASSMDEEAWTDPDDGDNRWERFAAARQALMPPQPEGVKRT